ncbi:MAG: metallophosphoesterase [Phycisphaerae bacterium]
MFVVIVLLIVLTADAFWWFAADRFARQLVARRKWRIAVAVFGGFQVLSIVMVLGHRLAERAGMIDFDLPAWLVAFFMVWHLIVLPTTLIVYVLISAGLGLEALTRPRDVRPPIATPGVSRRAFLATAITSPPVLSAVGAGVGLARQEAIRVRRFDIPVAGLPPELAGLQIAHVSDSHVGVFTKGPVLERLVEITNGIGADLVCVTGDLINHSLGDLPAAAEMVRAFRSRLGTYLCEGNHDLFQGRRAFRNNCEKLGLDLLTNDTRMLNVGGARLQLLGLRWGGRLNAQGEGEGDRGYQRSEQAIEDSLAELDALRDPAATQVLLAHHPHAFDPALARGIPLSLTGHSHGGQLMLPGGVGFGPLMYRYYSGLYQGTSANGPCSNVVSNGCGNWFPLRVNAPAEVLALTLVRA